jgi:hypothetical protein
MLKEGVFVDVKAFQVCSFAIGIRGIPFVWGRPYKNMTETDILASPIQLHYSEHTENFLKDNPFVVTKKIEKKIKKKAEKFKTIDSCEELTTETTLI